MKKGTTMARQKTEEQKGHPQAAEQLQLIDVGPANLKQIKFAARRYRAAMKRRLAALEEEVKAKRQILDLVKQAKLIPLADGIIKFKCDTLLITVTPRDQLVRVKDESGDGDDGSDE